MTLSARVLVRGVSALAIVLGLSTAAHAQTRITCTSQPGGREQCAADTSSGVILARSTGEAPCLLGKTWGYDDKGVWVTDGCGGEFVVAAAAPDEESQAKKKPFAYVPNVVVLVAGAWLVVRHRRRSAAGISPTGSNSKSGWRPRQEPDQTCDAPRHDR